MEGVDSHKDNDELLEYSEYTPTLYAALQVIRNLTHLHAIV